MSEPSTFVKLDRNILRWGWYKNANTFRLFVHLILTANIKEGKFETTVVKRGQLVTSYPKLAEQLGLTVKAIRVALEHLKGTGEVAVKATPKYSIITVLKYDEYQNTAVKTAVKRQTEGSQAAVKGQQSKKEKNIKNIRMKERGGETPPSLRHCNIFGTFDNVLLTESEVDRLKEKYPQAYLAKIERLSVYLESSGKTYQNHYAKLLEWLEQDKDRDNQPKAFEAQTASYDIDELEKINILDD